MFFILLLILTFIATKIFIDYVPKLINKYGIYLTDLSIFLTFSHLKFY